MAKFGKVSEETQDLVDNIVSDTGLDNYMQFEVISTKMKQLIKISRAGKTAEYMSNKSDTVCIFIYEEAFDMLSHEAQNILLRDALNNVSYDGEKDKIVIGVPSITITVGGRAKWGDKLCNAAEAGVLAIQQIEEKKKEIKESCKKKK